MRLIRGTRVRNSDRGSGRDHLGSGSHYGADFISTAAAAAVAAAAVVVVLSMSRDAADE